MSYLGVNTAAARAVDKCSWDQRGQVRGWWYVGLGLALVVEGKHIHRAMNLLWNPKQDPFLRPCCQLPCHHPVPGTSFQRASLGNLPVSEATLTFKVPRVPLMGPVWQGHKLRLGIRRLVSQARSAPEARGMDASQGPLSLPCKRRGWRELLSSLTLHSCA